MIDHSANDSESVSPAPPARFEVRESWLGQIAVLSVRHEVDMLTAPQLTEAIHDAFSRAPAALIIDLSEVQFLASAGMTVLVAAREEAGQSTRFAVVADGPATSRPIEVLGIDNFLALYPTLDDALRDVG